MAVLDSLIKAGDRVSTEAVSYRDLVLNTSKDQNDIDALILNHSYPASDVAKLCGMTRPTFKDFVDTSIEMGVIPEVLKTGNQYRYTLFHIHALLEYLEANEKLKTPSWSKRYSNTHIINIANLKGGTGKSTTALSLAISTALNLTERPRVLLIDLDPQGSQSQNAAIDVENDNSILTSVDLMIGEYEQNSVYQQLINAGHEHRQIVKDSVINTHIPNLKVLPSFPDDERFNSAAWQQFVIDSQKSDDATMTHISLLKENVISHLEDDFDIIIIDTAPQLNPLVWSAVEASNGLLIPCTPHALDWTSTQSFIKSLPSIMQNNLPSQGSNLKWWKVLAANFDDEHSRDLPTLNRMKDALGSDLFNTQIKRSQAFEQATQNFRTVLDIRKKEKLCSDKQLDKAVDSLRDVTRELMMHLKDIEL